MTCSVERLKWFCRCWRWKWAYSHLAREVKFKTAMTLTPWQLLVCGLDINITLFPDRYSPTFLPEHHSSIPTSAFQFRACRHVGLLLYHLSQAALDSWTMTAPCRGDRRVRVASGPGHTSRSRASFLGQERLCAHTADNCSAPAERRYSWWWVARLFTHRNQVFLSAQHLLFSVTSAWLWTQAESRLLYH